jgi:rRNA maturation protein Nop10
MTYRSTADSPRSSATEEPCRAGARELLRAERAGREKTLPAAGTATSAGTGSSTASPVPHRFTLKDELGQKRSQQQHARRGQGRGKELSPSGL